MSQFDEEQKKIIATAQARLASRGGAPKSEAYQRGAQMSPYAQAALTAAQGATLTLPTNWRGWLAPNIRKWCAGRLKLTPSKIRWRHWD